MAHRTSLFDMDQFMVFVRPLALVEFSMMAIFQVMVFDRLADQRMVELIVAKGV